MKVLLFVLSSLFTSLVFSETKRFNCVLDKWFDNPVDTNVFFSLTQKDDFYLDNYGRQNSVSYEDDETISFILERDQTIYVTVINKINNTITQSSTRDNLVTVLKGSCE